MRKGILILVAVATFVVAPLCAYLLTDTLRQSNTQNILNPQKRDNNAIKQALEKENNTLDDQDKLQDISVTSVERLHDVWYIASVQYKTSSDTTPQSAIALVGDLNGDKDKLVVILKPDELFPQVNISNGIGVPYDVIDHINQYYDKEANNE